MFPKIRDSFRVKILFIHLVFILPGFLFSPLSSIASGATAEITAKSNKDPYYQKLISKYPQHRETIDYLYDSYSGWVIELSEKYGIAPILAMREASEDEYLGLFRTPDVFDDIFRTLSESVRSESKRAYLALKLTNSFLMIDPEKNYAEAFKKARDQDKRASSQGKPTRRYTESLFSQGLFPDNLWAEIKKYPDRYEFLLNELSKADIEILEYFAAYPNAAAFLLNTGRDGLRLFQETDGEIALLSYILSNEEQKKLPAFFKKYPGMAKAIALCGPEVFFTIKISPDFYFSLVNALSGPMDNRYFVAFAVFSKQIESSGDGKELLEFFESLSHDEKERIAFYVADMLNRLEYDSDDEAPLPIAPLFDPFFLKFVWRYGEAAMHVCSRFGDILPMGRLLMDEWQGGKRDITPVLEAIHDFGEMGLQAALMFRFNSRMQDVILGPIPGSRRRDALMFLFYGEAMGLYSNMSDWEKITMNLLDEYKAENATGRPLSKKGGLEAKEFIPGYDFVKTAYNAVVYGKTPTLGDLIFSAFDLVQIVPIGLGATTVIKEMVKNGVKKSIKRYVQQYVIDFGKKILSIGTGLSDDAGKLLQKSADAFRKLSLSELRKGGRRLISSIQKATGGTLRKIDWWSMITMSRFDMTDLRKIYTYARDLAETNGVVARNLYGRAHHCLTVLYSRPWMVKHATEAVLDGIIIEGVMQPVLFYAGALSVIDFLEEQSAIEKMIREKQK